MATWLTGREAIQYMKVSPSTFYRMVKNGRITAYTLPDVADPRYKAEELDALFTPKRDSEDN